MNVAAYQTITRVKAMKAEVCYRQLLLSQCLHQHVTPT
jgi:hypothetical protein